MRIAIVGMLVALLVSADAAAQSSAPCGGGPGRGDQQRARALYDQARTAADVPQRIRLFTQSLAEQASYEASYQLAETLLEQGRDLRAARGCYIMALGLAGTDAAKARAAARIAETYPLPACGSEHVNWLKASLKYHRYPAVEDALKRAITAQQQGNVVSAGRIQQSLGRCDPSDGDSGRSFGVEASVDLRINFAYDRADLTEQGYAQARELGRALSAAEFRGHDIVLIGHTDSRGELAYNDDLSRRRAETVRAFLVRDLGLPADRLRVEGRGERELLMSGTTEQDHALNRRVEVVVR
jgi:outer membrane protein OmpA-like peptidoglycan-associated protein